MILRAIFKAIKAVIDAIAKIIAWLLLAFGLWVPLLYSLVYVLIVVFFARVPLANTSALYFTGLFISLLGALWFSLARSNYKARLRKRKKGAGYNISEVEKKPKPTEEFDESVVDGAQPDAIQQPIEHHQPQQYPQPQPQQYAQPQYAQPQPQQYAQQQSQQYAQPQQYSQHQQYAQPQQFTPYQQPQQYGYEQAMENDSYNPQRDWSNSYQEQRSEPQHPWGRYSRSDRFSQFDNGDYNERPLANEQPRIFRLKQEPDMLVYEYSDRLDYYRRTPHGNEFVRRKFK